MIRRSQRITKAGNSNNSVAPSPKHSFLDVVTTSKVEKSIDVEGNSKINDYTVSGKLG
jgi:hypothetical protein